MFDNLKQRVEELEKLHRVDRDSRRDIRFDFRLLMKSVGKLRSRMESYERDRFRERLLAKEAEKNALRAEATELLDRIQRVKRKRGLTSIEADTAAFLRRLVSR